MEPVFPPSPRNDLGPADHGEGTASYLRRSARPQFTAARDRVNRWFVGLCSELQPSVLARLRDGDEHEFASAYWELYLHELLVRLGYDVSCEQELPNGRRIDFLARRGDESMYLEATVAHSPQAARAADARRNRLLRGLEEVSSDRFMLGLEIREAGHDDVPRLADLRRRLEAWLADLPHDPSPDRDRPDLPQFTWEVAGWELEFEAFPVEVEIPGQRIERPVGMVMDETGGMIDDVTPLRRALDRKAPRRYGQLDHPYVIAVCEYPWAHGDYDWHRRNVLYGASAIAFGDGRPPRHVRTPDGFWRGPGQQARNSRVAAVLFAAHLRPWTTEETLGWWTHPFADLAVPPRLIPEAVDRHWLNDAGEAQFAPRTRTAASLLGFA